MSCMTLYLARHGESYSNFKNVFIGRSEDPALTEKGISQAQSLADSLKGKHIAAIFSSTLLRTRQTAQILADKLCLPISFSEDLIEVNLGLLDGHDIANPAFLSVYQNTVTNWERGYPQACIPKGESLLDVKFRLDHFLNEHVLNRDWDGPVLFVGHGILWLSFIWAFCENHPPKIDDGFISKTHLSIVSRNTAGFILEKNNLNHEEIAILQNVR
jgi:broad specificity phosphatase PhoE